MDVFFTGILTLLAVTALFYIVFFGFIFYWHLKKATVVVVPAIFAFEVFIRGFLIVAAVSLLFKYIPYLVNYLNL